MLLLKKMTRPIVSVLKIALISHFLVLPSLRATCYQSLLFQALSTNPLFLHRVNTFLSRGEPVELPLTRWLFQSQMAAPFLEHLSNGIGQPSVAMLTLDSRYPPPRNGEQIEAIPSDAFTPLILPGRLIGNFLQRKSPHSEEFILSHILVGKFNKKFSRQFWHIHGGVHAVMGLCLNDVGLCFAPGILQPPMDHRFNSTGATGTELEEFIFAATRPSTEWQTRERNLVLLNTTDRHLIVPNQLALPSVHSTPAPSLWRDNFRIAVVYVYRSGPPPSEREFN